MGGDAVPASTLGALDFLRRGFTASVYGSGVPEGNFYSKKSNFRTSHIHAVGLDRPQA
jgi:hypothetical protein